MFLTFTACNAPPPASSGSSGSSEGATPPDQSTPPDESSVDVLRDPDISRNAWLEEEIDQLWEEGIAIDVTDFKAKAALCVGDKTEEEKLYYAMHALPMRDDYPYQEPSDYESIMQQVPKSMGFVENPSNSEMDDRFYGAWLGRFIGSSLGMPIEMWTPQSIRTWYEKAGAWPINNYVPTESRALQEDGLKLNSLTTTLDHIGQVPSDDDTRYTVLNLQVLRLYNITWDTWDRCRFACSAQRNVQHI